MALFLFLHPMKSYSLFFLVGLFYCLAEIPRANLFQLMDQSSAGSILKYFDYTEELNFHLPEFYNGGG